MKIAKNCLLVESDLRNWLINILNGEIVEIEKGALIENKDWYQFDASENIEIELKDKGFYLIDDINCLQEIKKKLFLIDSKAQRVHKKVNFIVSYNCNFRCPYCFEQIDKKNHAFISTDIVDTVYQCFGKSVEYIGLFGGEPLLEESREIIEYIYEKWPNAIYDITTNGYNIDLFIDILRKMKIDNVQVTLDGFGERHNKFRIHESGLLTFDKIIDNIKLLLQNNIKIIIRMNVDRNYINEVFDQKMKFEELFGFTDLISFNIGPLIQQSEEAIEMILYEAEAKRKKEDNRWNINKGNKYIVYSGLPIIKKILYDIPYRKSFTYCPANTNALYFDAEYEIYACVGLVGDSKYAIGEIRDNKIVYANDNIFRKNIVNQSKCSKCKLALLCGGGCQMNIQNRRCKHTQFMLYKILPMILDILY